MTAHQRVLRSGVILFLLGSWVACGGDSGPDDTTVSLTVDPIATPTNQLTQTITGTTDASSTVTATSPVDSSVTTANASGGFSLALALSENSSNLVTVSAVDPPGNQTSQMFTVIHDGIAPTASFNSPASGATTSGQSGFLISITMDDESSGVDLGTLAITNDADIGGIFKTDGTSSTEIAANEDLTGIFTSVSSSLASYTVADSLAFRAGGNVLTADVADLAGNLTSTSRSFTVGADPDRLIPVDATGSPSASATIQIGLANADLVSGVQFDITYDPAVIASVDAVSATDRAASFSDTPFNEIVAGQVRVLLFDGGGDTIDQGQGAILNLSVTIAGGAPLGNQAYTLESVVLSDTDGTSTAAADVTGLLTIQ